MATTLDNGPFHRGGTIGGDIDVADFPDLDGDLSNGSFSLLFSDNANGTSPHTIAVTVADPRWTATLPVNVSAGTKYNVALDDGVNSTFAFSNFVVAAAPAGNIGNLAVMVGLL